MAGLEDDLEEFIQDEAEFKLEIAVFHDVSGIRILLRGFHSELSEVQTDCCGIQPKITEFITHTSSTTDKIIKYTLFFTKNNTNKIKSIALPRPTKFYEEQIPQVVIPYA